MNYNLVFSFSHFSFFVSINWRIKSGRGKGREKENALWLYCTYNVQKGKCKMLLSTLYNNTLNGCHSPLLSPDNVIYFFIFLLITIVLICRHHNCHNLILFSYLNYRVLCWISCWGGPFRKLTTLTRLVFWMWNYNYWEWIANK